MNSIIKYVELDCFLDGQNSEMEFDSYPICRFIDKKETRVLLNAWFLKILCIWIAIGQIITISRIKKS